MSRLTESSDELFEVDQSVLVLVQEFEEAGRQCRSVATTDPRRECGEQLGELGRVDTVLLQVRQAGIVTLGCRATGAPITAGHVFGLKECTIQRERKTLHSEQTLLLLYF